MLFARTGRPSPIANCSHVPFSLENCPGGYLLLTWSHINNSGDVNDCLEPESKSSLFALRENNCSVTHIQRGIFHESGWGETLTRASGSLWIPFNLVFFILFQGSPENILSNKLWTCKALSQLLETICSWPWSILIFASNLCYLLWLCPVLLWLCIALIMTHTTGSTRDSPE